MREFFSGVGTGHTSGVWQEKPQERPEFRQRYQAQLAKLAKARKSEEMV
jgi:chlorophyllide a reductase subunit Y